jgi:glutamine amidotransferase
MCRLYAHRSSQGEALRGPLCTAANAVLAQSRRHPHGWGIAWYEAGVGRVRRGTAAAHADAAFGDAVELARSPIVLAHVRQATVGRVAPENTHPFVHGRWIFAHNGTIARFRTSDRVRASIEAEIDVGLRAGVVGETDSERVFRLFLTRLAGRRGARAPALGDVRTAFAETIATVSAIADTASEAPSALTLAASDGELLALCRWGRTLHASVSFGGGGAVAVASEPTGLGTWSEVPEGWFVGMEPGWGVNLEPLAEAGAPDRTAA